MGYGSDWGSGWGGGGAGDKPPPPNTFVSPLYPVPTGRRAGFVPPSRFSGEPTSGPLSGAAGAIFFSPALLQQNDTNEIDLDFIQVAVRARDAYSRPEEREGRVFRFSNSGTYRTNDPLYRTQPEYAVIAVLVQTIPPGPTTIVKIP